MAKNNNTIKEEKKGMVVENLKKMNAELMGLEKEDVLEAYVLAATMLKKLLEKGGASREVCIDELMPLVPERTTFVEKVKEEMFKKIKETRSRVVTCLSKEIEKVRRQKKAKQKAFLLNVLKISRDETWEHYQKRLSLINDNISTFLALPEKEQAECLTEFNIAAVSHLLIPVIVKKTLGKTRL